MPRAVWTGSLSFGLVSIPVALYPATQPKDVRFHLFDRQGRRVRYRRVAEEMDASPESTPRTIDDISATQSPPDGTVDADRSATPHDDEGGDGAGSQPDLAYGDLLRGYEVEPGRFAMLEPEEIEQIRPQRSSTIELEDFVELDDIDPVFFEKSYYLSPRRGAGKPYFLLQQALEHTRLVGIGRFVLRTKPHLVAVRTNGHALGLETLYFGDEVRSPSEVVRPAEDDVSAREMQLAEQLVGMRATKWDPDSYSDEYRQGLLRIIAEKAPLDSPDSPGASPQTGTSAVEELMDALKRSVEEAKAQKRDGAGPRSRTG
ncbi:MAG TPA: Ku protein [Actinomycetota bacterium]|nr:Ku protein [Actinomycetota bacterium]